MWGEGGEATAEGDGSELGRRKWQGQQLATSDVSVESRMGVTLAVPWRRGRWGERAGSLSLSNKLAKT